MTGFTEGAKLLEPVRKSYHGTLPTPKFHHDCTNCKFLGHRNGFDVYICTQGGLYPTIIARFSDEGSKYASGANFITSGECFAQPDGSPHWTNVCAAVIAESLLQLCTGKVD